MARAKLRAEDLTGLARSGPVRSDMERGELPEGWEWQKISDPEVAELIMGQSPPSDTYNSHGEGLPFYQGKADFGPMHPSPRHWCTSPSRVAQKNDVLMSVRAPVGPVNISTEDCCIGRGLIAIRAKTKADYLLLFYYLRSIEVEIAALGQGSTFASVSKKQIAEIEIPLPPLPEQRRIVARIEAFARRVEEALERLSKLDGEFDLLCRATLYDVSDGEPTPTPMRELVQQRTPNIPVSKDEIYHFAGLKSFGRGVFKSVVKSGAQFAYPRLTRLRAGDFVYLKLMAWEGAFGVVPSECDGLYVSPEYPVFEVNEERLLPEMLDVYFRSPAIWPTISEISTGTNARRKRLHPSAFLAYEIPLPPMRTQQRLREMKLRVDELRKRHAEQRRELEALMPSVLARAMRGEL